MNFSRWLASMTLCVFASVCVDAINFDVGPGKMECFYEEVHAGTNINGVYAVTHGSHLDIDVSVYQPDGHEVYTAKREGEGKFMIHAERDGTYKLCFSNMMSMMSHKTIKLALSTGEPLDISKLAKKETMDSVERWIVSISHTVRMISMLSPARPPLSLGEVDEKLVGFHQDEYNVLHERHLNTVTATNRRVKWWSFLECLSVMAVSGLQVVFIKRMFSKSGGPGVRRMV